MGHIARLAYRFRHQSSKASQSRSDDIAMKTYSKWKRKRRASCRKFLKRTLRMVTTQMIKQKRNKTNKSWIVIKWRLLAFSPHNWKVSLKWRSWKKKTLSSKILQKRAQSLVHPLRKVITQGETQSSSSLIRLLWQLHQMQLKPRSQQLSS